MSETRLATEGDAEFRGRPGETRAGMLRRDAALDELTFVTTSPTEVSASGTIVRASPSRTATAPHCRRTDSSPS